jgi:crossover junction endodeoxyribonuclease RuvC
MRVLGIDPGLALTGWAVVDKKNKPKLVDYGCITTRKTSESPKRLEKIFEDLQKIIKKYKPDVLALEKLFFNTNAKTAFMVGEARGVVKICGVLNKIRLEEFTPLQIKNCIVGYGRASKKQIQEMVKVSLGLSKIPKPDDAADAVAVALTYCFTNKMIAK